MKMIKVKLLLVALTCLAAPSYSDHLKTLKNKDNGPQDLQQQQSPPGYNYNSPNQQATSSGFNIPPPNGNQQYQQQPYPLQSQPQQPLPPSGYQSYYPYPGQYYQPQPLSQPPPQSLQQQPQPGSSRSARLLSPSQSQPSTLQSAPRNGPTPAYLTSPNGVPNGNNGRNLHDNNIIPGTFGGLNNQRPKKPYNKKYPLTTPLIKFKLGVISDPDKKNENNQDQGSNEEKQEEEKNVVTSTLKEGNLYIQQNLDDPSKTNITVDWEDGKNHTIKTGYTYAGRGMELSTLNVFNGNLYTCDDKTGIVYELPLNETTEDIEPIPWVILADGNYTGGQGFKCEWATIKDGDLYVGGHGDAKYNETGALIDKDDKFVKRITSSGEVTHLDWSKNFDKMATALDAHFPGYVVHEAAGWSDILQKWIFMPRKISQEQFKEGEESMSGTNKVILTDPEFEDIQVGEIGDLVPSHGFSGFKFIPGTGDQTIIALKTVENGETFESYIMAFDLRGNILLEETKFADDKFEGIEFL